MMFLFNYLKLGLWSTIYYYRPSDIVFDVLIINSTNIQIAITNVLIKLKITENLISVPKKPK